MTKIDKRSVIKGLVGMVGLAGLPGMANASTTSAPKPFIAELAIMHVAGTQYYDAYKVLEFLQEGHGLFLRREPDNQHDSRAIEVWYKAAFKLGYVPRMENRIVCRLMEQGHQVRAFVHEVAPDRYDCIRMKIYLEGGDS